jgi:integrase
VRNLKSGPKPQKLADGQGLYLLITPQGSKLWRFKYRFGGKEKLLSLGAYPDVGLQAARQLRDDMRRLVASNIDPSADRKEQYAKAATAERQERSQFELIAREWFTKYSPGWALSHSRTIIQRLERDVFPWLSARPITEIDERELLGILRRVEARGAVETAHRVSQVCGQIFNYAIALGVASRNPTTGLRGALPPVQVKHHAALTTPSDVAALVRAISTYQGSPVVQAALRFSFLTFQRPGEVRRAEWTEIDWEAALWRLPASKMKLRREHLVPLSRQALDLLRELQKTTGRWQWVFPGIGSKKRPISENTVRGALRRLGYENNEMTAHGFRTIASTLLNEQGWNRDVIERQLAHAERDEVRGAYNRAEWLDERRKMMQSWADYLDKLATPAAVIPLFSQA